MMRGNIMRSAMAMIELIFAIVIIAISVITIPSMMNIANSTSKGMIVDEDILKRMMGEITRVSQARWDRNSTEPDFYPLQIAGDLDLPCDRNVSGTFYRRNPNSSMPCSSNIPLMGVAPVNGDLNLSRGIEQLHNNPYNLDVNTTSGIISVPILYNVSYINDSFVTPDANGTASAIWRLGSSSTMNPNASGTQTHLKRIVVRVNNANNPNVDMTLTFLKSNVGKFAE